MVRFFFLLFHLYFSLTVSLTAQTKVTFVPGELLIQCDIGFDPTNDILSPGADSSLKNSIIQISSVSRNLNIWKITFDHNQYDEALLLRNLANFEQILAVQRNHIGSFRRSPNDPNFYLQWHLLNSGLNNGLVGADVGILQAWEKTTGGKTVNGHDIIVAVIDDGIDLNHKDLVGNFWKNAGEIPDNGLDDDRNGFIDDFHGWNATMSSGEMISSGSHGTSVIGVIGAKGNNAEGIAGINWNIKIMPVILEYIVESAILEAYDYILQQRKLFNESNGSAGAFVVATNSSWGIDFGKPQDSPLWCAMYDSLGGVGILSVAATANLNINVDEVGDLPTACGSPYLIGVTSSNRVDGRGVAAFGKESIDIAAPGESIFFTRSNNRYGTGSGTSFASPMVAGAIGLLYSSNSPNFLKHVIENPAATSLYIKQFLLDGAQKLTAFSNITVSGGRLQIANSLQLLEEQFNTCDAPSPPVLDEYLTNALDINWDDDANYYESYNIRYRENGNSIWTNVENVSPPYRMSNLQGCTVYDVQIQGVCAQATLSPYTETQFFKTDNCCEGPRFVDTLFVQPNAARFVWRKILPADFYFVEIKEPQDTIWREIISISDQLLIRGLKFCTTYQLRISSVCALDTSNYSELFTFQTKGCGACTEKVYCLPENESLSNLNIDIIKLDTFINDIDRLLSDYEDYTGPIKAKAERGKRYPFTLQFKTGQENPSTHIGVWIDYDHSGTFEEDSERAIYLLQYDDTTLVRNIAIPLNARIGTTRMRVATLDADLSDTLLACPIAPLTGKFEDYCIEILQQNCTGTTLLDTVSVGNATAKLEWTAVEEAIAYTFRWREKGAEKWVEELSDTVTSWTLDMLEPCKTYEFEVRSVCLFDTSQYVKLIFQTRCPTFVEDVDKNGLKISAFPNPYHSVLYLEVMQDEPSIINCRIYNMLGHTLSEKKINDIKKHHLVEWNTFDTYAPGVYIMEVRSGNKVSAIKIQKL
jgi:serine protease